MKASSHEKKTQNKPNQAYRNRIQSEELHIFKLHLMLLQKPEHLPLFCHSQQEYIEDCFSL